MWVHRGDPHDLIDYCKTCDKKRRLHFVWPSIFDGNYTCLCDACLDALIVRQTKTGGDVFFNIVRPDNEFYDWVVRSEPKQRCGASYASKGWEYRTVNGDCPNMAIRVHRTSETEYVFMCLECYENMLVLAKLAAV